MFKEYIRFLKAFTEHQGTRSNSNTLLVSLKTNMYPLKQ